MGFMTKQRKEVAKGIVQQVQEQLLPSDGCVHVMMITSFGKLGGTQVFSIDEKYNTQIDEIVCGIQNLGREVVDIKFDCQHGAGATGSGISYHTLIMYK